LAAPSGVAVGRCYGYDLRRLNPEYAGSVLFVSPLSVQWTDAVVSTQLLDTDVHGYHGELGSSAKIRGTGSPTVFACVSCGATEFALEAEFHYWDETIEQWAEDPNLGCRKLLQPLYAARRVLWVRHNERSKCP
jgi:hypothetical protein